jgi:cytochrome c oxidase cbb3-type subunit III
MSVSWSAFIILIVAINILGCVWLLWWTAKRKKGDGDAIQTTGHVWDGDLTEYNKPLPRWWINLFYLTIVFAIAYLIWFPGLGAFEGKGQWSSREQHDLDKKQADAKLAKSFSRFHNQPIDVIAQDAKALATGRRIFINNCAMCHGSDARGGRGFPNLADTNWQWPNKPDDILVTIREGRQAAMPALGTMMESEAGISEVVVYVQSLSGMKVSDALANAGKKRFEGICAACHGADGKGNPAIGAPNLTDDVWLYGNEFESMKKTVREGRNGQMPAHSGVLSETQIRLVGAYVWSQSQDKKADGK